MFGVSVDNTGNLPPQPGVYPDYFAPIVRNSAAGRELVVARWGMPTPPKFLEGKKTDSGVTNIRNPSSPHWRSQLRHRLTLSDAAEVTAAAPRAAAAARARVAARAQQPRAKVAAHATAARRSAAARAA